VSSNPAYGELYYIQLYVKGFVSDLHQVGGFLWVLWYHYALTEILLNVALYTKTISNVTIFIAIMKQLISI
jgi:hypothetical protein